ncbi:cytosine permease [Jeotgalibaca sp. A127]|uniref:cytosine permease n=1 Tax=Jeotgalibaca sp. A127 TaxID=3457324 RepID=UPI003FD54B03
MEQVNKVENYDKYVEYGYSEDVLPKKPEDRDWGISNFITLWMGAVHNIMGYMTVAGFFVLGLNVMQVITAVMLSAVIVSIGYALNGYAAAKYGLPFSMLIRDAFGVKGAIIPALIRGLIAGLVFFGTTTVVGAEATNIILTKIFPNYMSIGGDFSFMGLDLPTLISYVLLWIVTVALFMTGMNVLGKFGNWSSPLVYIFIIWAAIWAINMAGGFGEVMAYTPETTMESPLVFIACVSALVSNWAGPIVNISDFTSRAKKLTDALIGIPLGMIISYVLFAVTSVALVAGTEVAFGEPIFNIAYAIDRMENDFAAIMLILALNVGAISFVVFANLLPAGLQLSSLFPKRLTVKTGGILTAVIGTLIMPWKLVENASTLFLFYSFIGSIFGPIAGIMLSNFYLERHRLINLDEIYVKPGEEGRYPNGYNMRAIIVLLVSFAIPMSGAFLQNVAILKLLNDFAFFSGLIISFVLYTILSQSSPTREISVEK